MKNNINLTGSMSTKEASRLKGADDIPRRRETGRSDISINLTRISLGLP
jgi:hypothetical protein